MIYSIIFGFLTFFSLLEYLIDNKKRIFYIFNFWVIFLIIFAGLRENVGYDYWNYKMYYETILEDGFINHPSFEFLIGFIFYLFKLLQNNFQFLLFLIAFFSIILKANFIWEYSRLPILSILLYYTRIFIVNDFGQIRQGIALGITLYILKYLIQNNKNKYYILVLFASLFHTSALFLLPFYSLFRIDLNRKYYFIFILICIPIAFFDLKEFISNYLFFFLPKSLIFKLNYYALGDEIDKVVGFSFAILIRFIIIVFVLFTYFSTFKNDIFLKVVFNVYFFGFLFYLVFNSFPQICTRGTLYFQQFEIILIPYLMIKFKRRYINFFVLILIYLYSFRGISTTIFGREGYQFTPYNLYFIKNENSI
jgi:hypothetical protein